MFKQTSASSYENLTEPFPETVEFKATFSNQPEVNLFLTSSTSVVQRAIGLTLYACTILLLSGIIIFQAYTLPHKSQKMPTGREFGGCGSSVAEARAIGCRFEPMSWQWIPEQCYYTELVESFLSRADWHFYHNYTLDPADEIDLADILAGNHEVVYTPDMYHPIHCTYEWIKLHKAFLEKLPIDNIGSSMGHTHHCEMNVLNPYTNELGAGNCTDGVCATRLSVTFNSCGYY